MEPTDEIRTFKYVMPEFDRGKKVIWMAKTDRLFSTVQVVKQGGETNLHAHNHLDGLWFVLDGRARFYSDETVLAAELGKHEGILIPRGVKYWFESVGDEPLELLQVECADMPIWTQQELMSDRVDYTPPKGPIGTSA